MIHFRLVLDRSHKEIKDLQNIQIQKMEEKKIKGLKEHEYEYDYIKDLNNLFSRSNICYEEIWDISNKFNGNLRDFKESFLKELFVFLNKNEEIHKLKEIIISLKL